MTTKDRQSPRGAWSASLTCDECVLCVQVNTWLTWLQQQESEDEEAED